MVPLNLVNPTDLQRRAITLKFGRDAWQFDPSEGFFAVDQATADAIELFISTFDPVAEEALIDNDDMDRLFMNNERWRVFVKWQSLKDGVAPSVIRDQLLAAKKLI